MSVEIRGTELVKGAALAVTPSSPWNEEIHGMEERGTSTTVAS